jgi:2-oxoglutarate/2-oxoacid ferredoxin oxidoreductase subunit alpha
MNAGQMVHDVREAVGHHTPVKFMGRMGGIIPLPSEVDKEILRLLKAVDSPALRMEASNGRVARK